MTTKKIGDVVIRKIVKNAIIIEESDVKPLQKSTLNDNITVLKKELPFISPKQVLDLDKCRICNDKKGIISIFGIAELYLAKEIFNFSGVRVDSTDQLPQKICQRCLDLLNGCIMFRDMCQKTNTLLIELLEKKETKNDFGVIVQIHRVKNEDDSADVNILDSDEDFYYPIHATTTNSDKETYERSKETSIRTNSTREFNIPPDFKTEKAKTKRKIKRRTEQDCNDLCEICGKRLRGPRDYELHKNIHENKFPFHCDLCPYRGRTKDLLSTHSKSHLPDEEKPFKCPQCPYAVTTASNLQRHIKCRHSTSKPFKCDHCGKAFTLRSAVKKHIRVVHSNAKGILYNCDVCPKVYLDRHHLTRHRRLIHNITSERFGRWPAYLLAQRKKDSEKDEQMKASEEIWDDGGK